MVHFNRRRVHGRRLARPSRPEPPPAAERDNRSASTGFGVPSLDSPPPASPRAGQKDSTVALEAIRPNADPNAETAEGFPAVGA
jgi:hypothetical protein